MTLITQLLKSILKHSGLINLTAFPIRIPIAIETMAMNRDMSGFASWLNCLLPTTCFLLAGCTPKELSQHELSVYITNPDNGLIQTAEVNNTKIEVAYRPTDLWVHQEIQDEVVSKQVIDSLRKKYDSYYYFILSLSRNNKEALHQVGSFGEYSELVQTMSFRMPKYVTLTTAQQDTIPVGDFMMNRTYGLSSSTDIVFVFNKEKAKDKEWVQFNLNEFGLGVGNQRFRFMTTELEGTPRINFTID